MLLWELKRWATNRDNICQTYLLKDRYPKFAGILKTQQEKNLILKWALDLNKLLTKKISRQPLHEHVAGCQHHAIRRCKSKQGPTACMPTEMVKVQNADQPNIGGERKQPGHSLINSVTATASFAICQENELLACDSTVALPGTYPKELKTHVTTKTCAQS